MAWLASRRLVVGLLAVLLVAAECQSLFGDVTYDARLVVINRTDHVVNVGWGGSPHPISPPIDFQGGRSSRGCGYFTMVEGELEDGTLLFPAVPVACEGYPPRGEFEGVMGASVDIVCHPPFLVLSRSTAPPVGWDQQCTLDVEAIPDWPDSGWERPAFIDVEDQDGNIGVIHNVTDQPIEVAWRLRQYVVTIEPGAFLQVDCPIGYLSVTSRGRVIDRGTPLVCDPNPEFSKVAFGAAWVEYAVVCEWPYLVVRQQLADWRPEPCPLPLDRFPPVDGCWLPDGMERVSVRGFPQRASNVERCRQPRPFDDSTPMPFR